MITTAHGKMKRKSVTKESMDDTQYSTTTAERNSTGSTTTAASDFTSIGFTKLEIMAKPCLSYRVATKCLELLQRDGHIVAIPGNSYSITKKRKARILHYLETNPPS